MVFAGIVVGLLVFVPYLSTLAPTLLSYPEELDSPRSHSARVAGTTDASNRVKIGLVKRWAVSPLASKSSSGPGERGSSRRRATPTCTWTPRI